MCFDGILRPMSKLTTVKATRRMDAPLTVVGVILIATAFLGAFLVSYLTVGGTSTHGAVCNSTCLLPWAAELVLIVGGVVVLAAAYGLSTRERHRQTD